jgi:hypothetical protein
VAEADGERCLAFAKSAGYAKMMPWTNDVLGEGPSMTYEMKL